MSEAKKIFEWRRSLFSKVSIRLLPRPYAALCLIFITFFLTACSSLPEIRPPGPGLSPVLQQWCQGVFPAGPHQFIHSVEARLPDDSRVTAMGVVTLDPARGIVHCVIMTIEGFVLFDARHQQTLTVNRAVYPFDSQEFAESMMADVRLVFFPPARTLPTTGVFEKGFPGCRWRTADGSTVDVLLNPQQGWAIRQYDASDHLSRQVRAYAINPEGIPERIELSRYKFPRYTLKMTLLQVERLPQGDGRLN